MTSAAFEPGSTVVRRDVRDGKVWTAAPHRVLADDDTQLILVTWPGTAGYTLRPSWQWFHTRLVVIYAGDETDRRDSGDPHHRG